MDGNLVEVELLMTVLRGEADQGLRFSSKELES